MKSSEGKAYIKQFMNDVAQNYPKNVDIDPVELFEELEKDRDSGKLKDFIQDTLFRSRWSSNNKLIPLLFT